MTDIDGIGVIERPDLPGGWSAVVDRAVVDEVDALNAITGNVTRPGLRFIRVRDTLHAARELGSTPATFLAAARLRESSDEHQRRLLPAQDFPTLLLLAATDGECASLILESNGFGNDELWTVAYEHTETHSVEGDVDDDTGRTIAHHTWHPILHEDWYDDHQWLPPSVEDLRRLYAHEECRFFDLEELAREQDPYGSGSPPVSCDTEPEFRRWREEINPDEKTGIGMLIVKDQHHVIHVVAAPPEPKPDGSDLRAAVPEPSGDFDVYDEWLLTEVMWQPVTDCGTAWTVMASVTDLRSRPELCASCVSGDLPRHLPLKRIPVAEASKPA